ncbi:uncharacterized protein LOC132724131 isoform X2 [Ruditapes philippinarum]|uniref:uncharacterized protein LOC132724131 isoform X2 n=1 Tax=Ruditapes philippinarum TaxID=129788 RepID=UPI00295AC5E2|nr:uncharacterized protein LOC132724131 isoform X2 [Ruditapes philippinarum]
MATISNERHLRYILLLGEGGTLVLKEILERETVKSSKSLGNLLDADKNALTRRIEKHILPKVFGPDANQDAWDIQLLSTVILQLFKKSLTKDENNCITKLKELRNELAHASSLSMDVEEYDDDRKELSSVLIQLSNGLDKSVHDKCQNFIKDFATGPIDIQSATERVKEFSKYDDKIQTELDKLTGKLEDVSTTVKDVSVKVDSVAVEMKVVGTEMELRGPNDHLTNMAEESLVRLFRSALERTGGDRDLTKIGHAINVILSEIESCNKVKVLGVDQQCIVIKMRCNNCQGLLELLEYLEGSRFKRRLHELVAALEITYKARFHLSSQIALGDLKNLLWNLRHLDEDKHGSKDDVINAERIQKEQHEAIYTEGKPTRIKVCGLPSDVTTDFLTLFFENKRKGGGVPVRKVSFYNDISTAVIEFESPEGVETVLSRRNIEMMGQAVTVVLYQPELRTVEVRGPTQIVCEGNIELLKSHFSNVGAVMKILYDRGRNSVLVTFETEEVAKKMLMRTHVINGKLLEVSLYTCSVREIYFRDRILLKGISSSTSEDNISHFLEATTGIKPMRIAYHKSNDDTALIEMESMPDITELKEVCKVHTVDGVHLDVCSVAISNCILVENVPNHFTSELLEQYFENKVRSGGDLVEKIIKIEGLSALVYFKDKIAVADVLEHFHQLDIETLKVSLFYECLQLTEKDAFDLSVPDPVTLFGIDNDKLEFIKETPHMESLYMDTCKLVLQR